MGSRRGFYVTKEVNMEEIIDFCFLASLACFILAVIQSHRMFYKFREKYPEITKKKILGSFESYRNPEKFLFFYRRENTSFFKNDPEIWKLHQQTKYLFIVAVVILLILFGGVIITVITHLF